MHSQITFFEIFGFVTLKRYGFYPIQTKSLTVRNMVFDNLYTLCFLYSFRMAKYPDILIDTGTGNGSSTSNATWNRHISNIR